GELRDRLQGKLTRIQKEVERRAAAGMPPEEAVKLMENFPEQMRSGKHHEAEAILDRVLRMLDLVEEKKSGDQKLPEKKSPDKQAPAKESPARGGSKPTPASRSSSTSPL